MKRRWRIKLGTLPHAVVALAGVVCSVLVWPSDLSWGCLSISAIALFSTMSYSVEFADPESGDGAG